MCALEPAASPLVLGAGTAVGPYVVMERLGGGGMGQVFLARDSRLQRKVALKYLIETGGRGDTPDTVLREARAAARINHPNVAAIYDILNDGVRAFIVMEYLEGETLASTLARRRFTFVEAATIGRQLAAGLAAAHAEGVIHRDIKPSNVQFARDGTPKILDFGVARTTSSILTTRSADRDADRVETDPPPRWGGTPLYMSPEQRGGLPIDERSDIYSLGLVLHEMVTGRPAPHAPHDMPGVPASFAEVIRRAVDPDPRRRFGSASELSAALAALDLSDIASAPYSRSWWMAVAAGLLLIMAGVAVLMLRDGHVTRASIRSLAVLPFVNDTRDPDQEYLADGTTDGLINMLGQISGLQVSARTSSMQFKNTTKTLGQIARELQVDALLEGSVSLERHDHTIERVRVAVNLIDPSTQKQIWSDTIERTASGILELQSEIARAVVDRMNLAITGEEKGRLAVAPPQVELEAYRFYVMGRERWNERTAAALGEALDLFQRAIAMDPTYAPAHAGLADTYALLAGDFGAVNADTGADAAIAAATRALALDSRSAEAYASLGFTNFFLKWNWPAAEAQFRLAVQLNPSYATAHHWYGNFLSDMGREDESLAEMRRALELDPLAAIISRDVAWPLFHARRYDAAVQQLQTTLAAHPGFMPAERLLARSEAMNGRAAEAVAEFERQRARDDSSRSRCELAWAYAVAGRIGDAQRTFAEARAIVPSRAYPYDEALVLTALGRKQEALDALDRAYDRRDPTLVNLKHDPRLQSLHPDPRFARLLALMRFP
jgi:serine/threonine-protein kinase